MTKFYKFSIALPLGILMLSCQTIVSKSKFKLFSVAVYWDISLNIQIYKSSYPKYHRYGISGFPQNLWKKFHDFSMLKSKYPDTKYQHKFCAYLLLRFIYQFIESIQDIYMDIHIYTLFNQNQPIIQRILLSKIGNCSDQQKKLDTTRRKALEVCLHWPLNINSQAFSRQCPETPNMTCQVVPKRRKSTDHDQNLISSEGGQDTSACNISGHSLHASSRKCPETSADGRTDRLKNCHGWSDQLWDPWHISHR